MLRETNSSLAIAPKLMWVGRYRRTRSSAGVKGVALSPTRRAEALVVRLTSSHLRRKRARVRVPAERELGVAHEHPSGGDVALQLVGAREEKHRLHHEPRDRR